MNVLKGDAPSCASLPCKHRGYWKTCRKRHVFTTNYRWNICH